ncbi:hypothetical protein PUN28_004409 [Cardiocondyla obscurior]|uniref:Glucosylceramidase n=1 Tax=Cardiocondyla obscurior TaxID=286306 RepID=A0AAW2GGR5_9HYME
MWRTIIFIITIPVIIAATNGCIKRQSNESGDDDGYYCVCNAVQCDEAPEAIKPLNPEKYVLITSSKSGLFFDVSNGVFELKKTSGKQRSCFVRTPKPLGVGLKLPSISRTFLNILFPFRNKKCSLLRPNKENSSPMIIVNRTDVYQEILGFGGAVTDSVGKNIHSLSNETSNHLIRYFEVYRRNGLEFWGVTTQNEPENYKYIPQSVNLNGMRWTPEEESDWIVEYLAPTLKKNNFGNIKILTLDDNRMSLPDWPKTVFSNKKARDIIFGIAVHFYFDATVGPNVLDEVKELFPEKTLLYTEAALGVFQEKPVILGSWKRGELYAHNIIENLSHWVSSWVDWNIALNTDGGPNWIGNNVDSTIIVNSTADEFYKQPMFYSIGHFSKNEEEKEILINDPEKGTAKINVRGKSINTMKYW